MLKFLTGQKTADFINGLTAIHNGNVCDAFKKSQNSLV